MRYDKENKRLEKLNNELLKVKSEYERLIQVHQRLQSILESLMHETRRFSADISTNAEVLSKKLVSSTDTKTRDISETIFYTTGLLSSRMLFTDMELNPQILHRLIRFRMGIYKKFDKARHILSKSARFNQLTIDFSGNSLLEVEALQAFDLVPYILLENAIKYSPPNQPILVTFNENNNELEVIVSSMGPLVSLDETKSIFERGTRGLGAINSSIPGEGLGLYLVKTICDIHSFDIKAKPSNESSYSMNSNSYAKFEIFLTVRCT